MIFKENAQQRYQLLTKTSVEGGSFGASPLFEGYFSEYDNVIQHLIQNLEKFGHDKIGAFYTDGNAWYGTYAEGLYVLLLSDDKIQDLFVTGNEGSNEGSYDENSPLYYSYQSTWSVDRSQPALSYYPIKVHFTGEEYNENLKKPRITEKNQIETYVYDEKSKEYKLKYTEKLKD